MEMEIYLDKMQRYFLTSVDNVSVLSNDDLHHIIHVMRMKVGDCFEVVDNGKLYVCKITSMNPFLFEKELKEDNSEIKTEVTLFFALAKGDKIDFVIQKATELGAHKIVLFKSKRCVTNFDGKDINKKISRYYKIAKEAAEQSHRLIIPEIIGVVDIKDVNKYMSQLNFLAYEKNAGPTDESFLIPKGTKSVSVMIGSEGGFEEEEVKLLEQKGFKCVSLGKRILRCETAAVYALSVLGYKLEQ